MIKKGERLAAAIIHVKKNNVKCKCVKDGIAELVTPTAHAKSPTRGVPVT